MLTRLTKVQLSLFAVVTTVALSIMAAVYVQIPAQLGIGRYSFRVELPQTGGLYPKSVVTYRGQEVGVVSDISLGEGGRSVIAKLSIDNGVLIPAASQVQVRSASVIGEQYLNFLPEGGGGRVLREGDLVPSSQAVIPTSTTELVTSVQQLVDSVPEQALRTSIEELGKAFQKTDDLGRLLDAGSNLQKVANANLQSTIDLLDQLGPVLLTQEKSSPNLQRWAANLNTLTAQLAQSDAALRGVLTSTPSTAEAGSDLFTGLEPNLPGVLNNIADVGEVTKVYDPGVQHVLTVFPAALEALMASVPRNRRGLPIQEANLSFKLGVNDPPVCTTGFPEAGKFRSPKDFSPKPESKDAYCKIPHDDLRVVRGARNQKCPNGPDLYGATAASCGLIFQKNVVDGTDALKDAPDGAETSPVGEFLAPNGLLYLFGGTAAKSTPRSFSELVNRLVTP